MKVVSEIGLFKLQIHPFIEVTCLKIKPIQQIIVNFSLPSLESATIEFENLDSLVPTGTVTEVGTPA